MKWTGVMLNSNHDGLDGRYSPQRENPEPLPYDFSEDFDQYDVEPLPDLELEGD